MGFLNMLGLMRVEDHNKAIERQNAVLADKNATIRELTADCDKARAEARKATDDCAKLVKDYRTRGELLSAARKERNEAEVKFKAAVIDLEAQSREIAALRPDAEWARARKAKAAEYEASKRVRKAAKKGAA